MEKGRVIISLPPHLSDFCRYEFKTKEAEIEINRAHDIGKQIFAQVCVSELPLKPSNDVNSVTFILPTSPHVNLGQHFTYISKWGETKIRDFIQVEFNRNARDFFEKGYQKGYLQKEIIEGFLVGHNIRHNAISYEAVKKNDYRKRLKRAKEIFEDIESAMVQ